MLFSTILAFAALALASPTPADTAAKLEKRVAFNTPWIIDSFMIMDHPTTKKNATISMHFMDNNEGIELETHCVRIAETVIDGDNFYECDNGTVSYQYDGTTLSVQRGYVDDSLGTYPYNQGVAFGSSSSVPWSSTAQFAAGRMGMATRMNVPITSMIAKKL